jgi:hypothetical protein
LLPHNLERPLDADDSRDPSHERAFAEAPAWLRRALIAAAAAGALAVSALVLTRKWAIGIPGEWQWSFREVSVSPLLLLPSLFMLLLLAALAGLTARRGMANRREEAVALCIALALALGVILGVGNASPIGEYSAFDSIVVPWAGGYYGEAARVEDMGEYLNDYAGTIASLRVNDLVRGHVADHPVGPVLFHWLINRAMERSPSLTRRFTPDGADQPLYEGAADTPRRLAEQLSRTPLSEGAFAGIWASAFLFRIGFWLALPLVYLLARDLYSRETALVALALAAVIPSLHLFGPYPDQLFPLFFMAAVFCWHRALRDQSPLWAAGAGIIALIGLLWSLSLLAIPATLFLWTLLDAWRRRAAGRGILFLNWAALIAAASGAFLAASLLPTVLFGYDTWRVWRICLSQHATFASLFPRSYMAWVLFNPVEFAIFTGWPIALLFAAVCGMDLLGRRNGKRATPSPALWAIVGVILALDLSGKNLGETARLWMFFMPLAAVGAAAVLMGLDRRRGWLVAVVVALGALQLAAFQANLNVFKP